MRPTPTEESDLHDPCPLRGATVWLTGVPASGKTTLARGLRDRLRAVGEPVLWLDSDDLWARMAPSDRALAPDARARFYDLLTHLATRSAEGDVTTIISATSARRADRDAVRARVPRFLEVLVVCDPVELRRRDPRGLYAGFDAGTVRNLPGVDVPFEDPADPAAVVDTTGRDAEAVVAELLAHLVDRR